VRLPVSGFELPRRWLWGCGLRRGVAAAASEPVAEGGALGLVDGEARSPSGTRLAHLRDVRACRSTGTGQAGEALTLLIGRIGHDEDS
jgi:hypothetical protein